MPSNFEAELRLVITGNHDLELDEGWCKAHLEEDEDYLDDHARAMEVMKGELAKEPVVTYLEEGTHTFNLKSGATFKIYASPYQHEFNDYTSPYKRNEDRFNASGETAEGVTSIAENPIPADEDEMKREDDLVNKYPQAMDLHIESGKETLMVNAAILDGEHQPTNAPWIINLDLPSS
ncbi:uncharacterized protein EAE98_004215 [Botrytis deweyae]|uniref:Uncharacterized protein n=1 Tax=Botrytis deweyae TaxID=2478750 RepID=A0ABQ7IQI9_9HELO|nr:uncharacterized protein EAE98_004215 [Botrytis deweyae]KAF7931479.1 hypothetical protein EAE98_004215 [Botrytis deweyae]